MKERNNSSVCRNNDRRSIEYVSTTSLGNYLTVGTR